MSLNFLSHPFHRAFSFSIMARFFPARNLFRPTCYSKFTLSLHRRCNCDDCVEGECRGKGRCPLTPAGTLSLHPAREFLP